MPLEDRLKKIPKNKEANVLRAIKSMKEIGCIFVELKYNLLNKKVYVIRIFFNIVAICLIYNSYFFVTDNFLHYISCICFFC